MAGKLVASKAQDQIFHDLITKRAAEPGTGKDSIPLFHCFKRVFDQINVREGKLRGANRATTLDLTGIDAMWAFLVAETPDESLNACIDKLISLVLGLHKSAYGGSKKKGWETFMEKCMELIRNPEATDAQLQSVLRLLSQFLKKVSKETLQYDPQVGAFYLLFRFIVLFFFFFFFPSPFPVVMYSSSTFLPPPTRTPARPPYPKLKHNSAPK